MLDKLSALFKLPKEYIDEMKITWIGDELEIINYGFLKSYGSNQIEFTSVIIKGFELKLLYQDPYVVKVKGKIKEILKEKNNGLSNIFGL